VVYDNSSSLGSPHNWLFPGKKIDKAGTVCEENSVMVLKSPAISYATLELRDGCVFLLDENLDSATVIVETLILHGASTIDLTPRWGIPLKPNTPGPAPNLSVMGEAFEGRHGSNGNGVPDKKTHIEFSMVVDTVHRENGSLWIKTDGWRGGDGGDGGRGGQGYN
jgi:hypothetical protein